MPSLGFHLQLISGTQEGRTGPSMEASPMSIADYMETISAVSIAMRAAGHLSDGGMHEPRLLCGLPGRNPGGGFVQARREAADRVLDLRLGDDHRRTEADGVGDVADDQA